jgi:hypothetical protein
VRRKTWRWSWCASSWRRARLRAGFARAFSFSNHSLMSSPCSGKYPFPKGLHLDLCVCRPERGMPRALAADAPQNTPMYVQARTEFPCFNKTIKRLRTSSSPLRAASGTIGLGMFSEYARTRVPRPPQKSTTFIAALARSFGQFGGASSWSCSCL